MNRFHYYRALLALAGAVASVAACSDKTEMRQAMEANHPDKAHVASGSAVSTGPAATTDGVVFNVIPTGECADAETYTAEVQWQVPPGTGSGDLEVRVNTPDGHLLSHQQARKSSARTGNWVKAGMQFYLVDRADSQAIANATAQDAQCAQAMNQS